MSSRVNLIVNLNKKIMSPDGYRRGTLAPLINDDIDSVGNEINLTN
jgi:hypothetical protein